MPRARVPSGRRTAVLAVRQRENHAARRPAPRPDVLRRPPPHCQFARLHEDDRLRIFNGHRRRGQFPRPLFRDEKSRRKDARIGERPRACVLRRERRRQNLPARRRLRKHGLRRENRLNRRRAHYIRQAASRFAGRNFRLLQHALRHPQHHRARLQIRPPRQPRLADSRKGRAD